MPGCEAGHCAIAIDRLFMSYKASWAPKTQMNDLRVSVLIVNWNAGILLERCVESLLTQTLRPVEIIVVDNASSDQSIKNIENKFPDVRLIQAGQNLGFAAANNLGIRAIASDWIVLLNPDAFPEPKWLETLLDVAQRNPEYAIFGSRLVNANVPSILDGMGDIYHFSGLVWRAGYGQKFPESVTDPIEIFSPCAAAAMYRRDAFLEAGGFDEDFFCYVEDVDIGFRLRLLGYRCLYVPDSVAHHVGSAVTGKRSDFSVYHGHRNLVWTYVKNMPGFLFWVLLPLHVLLNIVSLVHFSLRGQGKVILRAKWDAVKGISKMWRKRRVIQAHRIASVREIWQAMNKSLIPFR